jgi:spermidine synthase
LKKPRRTAPGRNLPGNSIPRWKYLLSYFTDIPVESLSSRVHPELNITLQQGRLQLSTAKAVYSFGDLYYNFSRVFSAIRVRERAIDQVLLLGLGLGSIPELLEKKFRRTYHYTAVEIDEAIIHLAQQYTLSRLKSGFDIYCADAGAYIRAVPDGAFALVCVDLFIDDLIPAPFTGVSFMEELKRVMAPGGILVFNCFAMESEDRRRAQRVFENSFLPVFPNGTYLDVGTNWMLLNDRTLLD